MAADHLPFPTVLTSSREVLFECGSDDYLLRRESALAVRLLSGAGLEAIAYKTVFLFISLPPPVDLEALKEAFAQVEDAGVPRLYFLPRNQQGKSFFHFDAPLLA